MICLGLDPGTLSTGIALYEDGEVTYMECAQLPRPKKGQKPPSRLFGMIEEVERKISSWQNKDVSRIAVEWQHIRPVGERRPNDICNLAHFCGALAGLLHTIWPDARFLFPVPSDWKGQVKKPIHHKRLTSAHPEVLEFGMNKGQMKDALDAVGLAVWASTRHYVPLGLEFEP